MTGGYCGMMEAVSEARQKPAAAQLWRHLR
jgi:hypothetical protein